MLQAMLLAAIVAAPIGSAALFLPVRRHTRSAGIWSAIRRFGLAVLGTVVLAAAVAAVLRALGVSTSATSSRASTGVVFDEPALDARDQGDGPPVPTCAWRPACSLFVVYLVYALERPCGVRGGVV